MKDARKAIMDAIAAVRCDSSFPGEQMAARGIEIYEADLERLKPDVSLDLLRDIQVALNDIPNTRLGGERWTSTYELQAELTKHLRSACPSEEEGPEFENHYHCPDCQEDWTVWWSCMCDDKCPTCNKAYSPHTSQEL